MTTFQPSTTVRSDDPPVTLINIISPAQERVEENDITCSRWLMNIIQTLQYLSAYLIDIKKTMGLTGYLLGGVWDEDHK